MSGYAEYQRPLWPWQWVRWWLHRARVRREPRDRSDGQLYVGWTARLTEPDGEYPAGSEGVVVGTDTQCGELAHTIQFDGWRLTVPLPWRGIDLVEPGGRHGASAA